MKFRLSKVFIRTLFAFLVVLLISAAGLKSAGRNFFKRDDRMAQKADPAAVSFIRPGLVFKISDASIAQDGTITARVKVTDPQGLGLDRLGINTPGTISMSFIAATIPAGKTQYVSYTTRVKAAVTGTATSIQAASDSGGAFTTNADGDYTYTFKTKAPAGFDPKATHTIGVYGTRNLKDLGFGYNEASNTFNFVPAGGAVTVVRDVIRDQSCTRCHDVISFHGGSRVGVALCVLCHTPQTGDPNNGNTVDFPVLIHKIHFSSALTKDYAITGFSGVSTWGPSGDQVTFPADGGNGSKNFITGKASVNAGVQRCETCHEQNSGATQAKNYQTNPNKAACGSCHDYVDFAAGTNHTGVVATDDTTCSTCHAATGKEFDASVKGAHTLPVESTQLPGMNFTILSITGSAGAPPVLTFTVKDNFGNPLDPASLKAFPNRMAAILAGPTTDFGYTNFGADVTSNGYVSEDLTNAKCGADGTCTYTFLHSVPAGAKGTFAIGLEGRRGGILNAGTPKEIGGNFEYGAKNVVGYFSVDGSPVVPRRKVVDIDKDCNRCHVKLSVHGENRNQTEFCVLCHNPSENDKARRDISTLKGTPPQSVNFTLMIHRIHSGEAQGTFIGRPFVVVGFGGSINDFSDVVFPAFHNYQSGGTSDALNKCYICHSNGSYNNNIDTMGNLNVVHDPQGIIVDSQPITAACMGCHNTTGAAAHALNNTNALGESCPVCHSASSDFSPMQLHIKNVEH